MALFERILQDFRDICSILGFFLNLAFIIYQVMKDAPKQGKSRRRKRKRDKP